MAEGTLAWHRTGDEAGTRLGQPDDVSLVQAFKAGDRRAFETLVRRHQKVVWAVALRLTGDAVTAEDLAQRAFLRAFERIDDLRGAFRPWLLAITANLGRNHRRDNAKLTDFEGVDEPFHQPDPGESLDEARRAERVRAAISRLPPRQREVLLMRIDGQLAFAEIASTLGITENAAKVNHHHAVRRLRELLGGNDEGV